MSFLRSASHWAVAAACLAQALALCACASFIDAYDAASYANLTRLKVFHIQFVEEFTQKDGAQFQEAALTAAASQGETKFLEAIEYSKNLGDSLRSDNIAILYAMFQANVSELKARGALLSVEYGANKLAQVNQAYDLAIAGERARTGAKN